MYIFGIVLVFLGACLTLVRLPLPINRDLDEIRTVWWIGPIIMVIGGVIWWAFWPANA